MNLSKWMTAVAALFVISSLHAQPAESFSSLEERMTGAEFRNTGLEKLSAAELAALNRWIRQRSLAESDTPVGGSESLPDRPSELPAINAMAREPFQTRIVGAFNGWTGDTEFELENGMRWRQADDTKFFIGEIENPVVTIKPSFMSSWRLSVEGYNSTVTVERIR
ncbi:MAG: hypothetical protein RQ741_04045 [Wenzhouxiangellaceae bacterium]|nr:hypothetical protein [Wenzhouxiangellaceae bacterium]